MDVLTVKEIEKAHKRISSYILKTPLISNSTINKITKANVYFKLENLQFTGSFKIRGAINKISQLSNFEKRKGIVAYSSGNHAQAVAYASKIFNTKATIVMPNNAPKIKIKNTKRHGAEIVFYEPKNENREEIAMQISSEAKQKIIKPYDDLDIIAGQGTSGKEIFDDLIEKKIVPDIYLCCCGGGGLIAGSSTYLKNKFPKIDNYAVEPEFFNDTQVSLKNKKIIENNNSGITICDALLADHPGKITFPINKNILKSGLTVTDYEVKETIVKLAENLKIIVEPGGAVAATALLKEKIKFKNKNIIVMISGGNIDYKLFSSLL